MTTAEEYRLLGFSAEDQADAEKLEVDPVLVAEFAAQLRKAIGGVPVEGQLKAPDDPMVSLAAYLETLPDIRRYHQERGVSDEISWATLADLGQQLKVNRRTFGKFGLETHWWVTTYWTGALYALGRLQFLIHPLPEEPKVPGVEPGEWVLGVHIPETGPLTPEAVDDSFDRARAFFAEHFPEHPVKTATLGSWLIDPYLLDHLPQDSNMVRFGRRFTPYGEPRDSQDSAIFFTFRSHDLGKLDEFPQDTALQRLIVARIKAGGTWQTGFGSLSL
ncbi:acyltransferase domain-containing protein [Kribbella sp. NPDC051770]|uniref:acyltransferase domain-containing protein n=1 Tax=Kribbella sp. NPDC051770 TaxID=3155413 RepID=UPI0034318A63